MSASYPFLPRSPASLQAQACRYAEDISLLLDQVEALQERCAASPPAGSTMAGEGQCRQYVDKAWQIESALEQALANDEFHLLYQPQVSADGRRLTGVEALLRWRTPLAEAPSPDIFIPLAERSGLIDEIGHWVLRTACRQLRLLQESGFGDLRMAVNVSPRQLHQPAFVAQVMQALAENALATSALELEITESDVMLYTDSALASLQELRAGGVSIAIDDFGTGHSSLARLHKLPVDRLKVDRSFIVDLDSDADARAISACIVGLARTLELEVIAEGVETAAQQRLLLEQGCHVIQGFLFARPMPAERLANWQRQRYARSASHG